MSSEPECDPAPRIKPPRGRDGKNVLGNEREQRVDTDEIGRRRQRELAAEREAVRERDKRARPVLVLQDDRRETAFERDASQREHSHC